MSDRPAWTELHLRCRKCETRWMDWQPTNCWVEVWIAAVGALRCPNCDAGPESIVIPAGTEVEIEAVKAPSPDLSSQ